MTANKTTPNHISPDEFIASITNDRRREDATEVLRMMKEETGAEPVMWGTSIVGFGVYHYKYASGREGDWMTIGLSPRSAALTLYGLIFYEEGRDKLEALGNCTSGKGCIYIKDLSKVNKDVLRQMIHTSFKEKNGRFLQG